MRKKILFLLCVVFSVLTVSAQKVENVVSVTKSGNGFVATLSTGRTVRVTNPYLYKRMRKAPSEYCYVTYNGEKKRDETFALKSNVSYAVLTVDSVGYNEDKDLAEVYLSDKTVYCSPNDEWLKVLVGQKVERWWVDGETIDLEHFRTVSRETPETTTVPVETTAPVSAQVTPPAGQNGGQMMTPPAGQGLGQTTTTATALTAPATTHRFVKR
ncbi:MAG: hypothetical protein IJ770_03685 [Alphaproteobacteria bacterium]|nr:hypothetical protein [Alphaproteobacteria bacterium]